MNPPVSAASPSAARPAMPQPAAAWWRRPQLGAWLLAALLAAVAYQAHSQRDDLRLLTALLSPDPAETVAAARGWMARHPDAALAQALADHAAATGETAAVAVAARDAVRRYQAGPMPSMAFGAAALAAIWAAAWAAWLGWRTRGAAARTASRGELADPAPAEPAEPSADGLPSVPAGPTGLTGLTAPPSRRATDEGPATEAPVAESVATHPPPEPTGLRAALLRDQVQLTYRPVVQLKDGAIVGVEACPVWLDPAHGEVSGPALRALAEATGQGDAFAHWLLRSACRDLAAWDAALGRRAAVTLRVAVSGSRVLDAGWPSLLRAVLQAHGESGERLMLGIDGALIHSPEAPARLRQLGAAGVGLALEGLGRGEATLGSLQRLPVQAVVIDAPWVERAQPGTPGQLVVEAAVRVAADRGLVVIADGLDSAERAGQLVAMGASHGQGDAIGGPLSVDAMARRLGGSTRIARSDLRDAPDPVA